MDYVRVEHERDFGFWEIDKDHNIAYFRGNNHKPENNKQVEDLSTFCKDIIQVLVYDKRYRVPYYKMINPNRKIIFGPKPFCEWEAHGMDAHDPNTVIQCNREAVVAVKEGKKFCMKHSNMKLTKSSLIH